MNLSGRGDKDVETASKYFGLVLMTACVGRPRQGEGRTSRAALIGYLPVGYPVRRRVDRRDARDGRAAACDIVEVGVPYSDPVMDGPTIQAAAAPAVRAGVGIGDALRAVAAVADAGAAAVVMTYWNPVERYGVDRFAADLAAAGGSGAITPDLIPDEAAPWLAATDAHRLDRIFLVAPSSTDARIVVHRRRLARLRLRRLD